MISCVFNRTFCSYKPPLFSFLFSFSFFFWIGPKIFFACPFGLLHNGDYASSYSRNVSIPAAHQNTDFPCQGMYLTSKDCMSESGQPAISYELIKLILVLISIIALLNENMWDFKLCGSYPLGQ